MVRKLLSRQKLELLEYVRIKLSNMVDDFWTHNLKNECFTKDAIMTDNLECEILSLCNIIINQSYLDCDSKLVEKYLSIGKDFRAFNAIARDDKGGIS